MKVYVLESGDCDDGDHLIEGVFSSDEKAGKANEILDIAGTVTEVELDQIEIRDRVAPWKHHRYEKIED